MNVMMKLMDRGANAESMPSPMEISMDMNMKRALTRRALPTFVDMTLTFIPIPGSLTILSASLSPP